MYLPARSKNTCNIKENSRLGGPSEKLTSNLDVTLKMERARDTYVVFLGSNYTNVRRATDHLIFENRSINDEPNHFSVS